MTVNLRAARALQRARLRMRDAALAAHAQVVAARERATRDVAAHAAEVDAGLARETEALAQARSVRTFDIIALRLRADAEDLRAAHQAEAEAARAAEASATLVRARAQQLRAAETLVERIDDARAATEAAAEQRSADDRAGRRR